MKNLLRVVLSSVYVSCLAISVGCQASAGRLETGQHAERFEGKVTKTVSVDYLLYLPARYHELPDHRWPLLLFLHGAGERGSDVEKVKKHGPPMMVEQGREFPFIVVSPQCPKHEGWDPATLDALLDRVMQRVRVDENRVYVTGLSMGGAGTWRMLLEYPERFAAGAPICGWGVPEQAARIAHLPIWVFHSRDDNAVPFQASEDMVIALRRCGSNVRFTTWDDAGHDCWVEAYSMDELFTWLLEQTRKPPQADITPAEPVAVATIEAERGDIKGAQVIDMAGASGERALAFTQPEDEASYSFDLPAGGYRVSLWMYCADGDHDSVHLEVSGRAMPAFHNSYGQLAVAAQQPMVHLDQPGRLTVRLWTREPGVAVDRIVIERLYDWPPGN